MVKRQQLGARGCSGGCKATSWWGRKGQRNQRAAPAIALLRNPMKAGGNDRSVCCAFAGTLMLWHSAALPGCWRRACCAYTAAPAAGTLGALLCAAHAATISTSQLGWHACQLFRVSFPITRPWLALLRTAPEGQPPHFPAEWLGWGAARPPFRPPPLTSPPPPRRRAGRPPLPWRTAVLCWAQACCAPAARRAARGTLQCSSCKGGGG